MHANAGPTHGLSVHESAGKCADAGRRCQNAVHHPTGYGLRVWPLEIYSHIDLSWFCQYGRHNLQVSEPWIPSHSDAYEFQWIVFHFFSIISEIVDGALKEEQQEFNVDDVGSVFRSILCDKDLDVRDKKSAIIDFIAAGIETLAHTLIFILNYVTVDTAKACSPQQRIFEEFEHCRDLIDSTDLSNAFYTKACLQETYRLCPTAFCLARILEQDTTLSGFNLSAGVREIRPKNDRSILKSLSILQTVVLCQTMTSCNDAANFKDADQYIPERWMNEEANISTRCAEPGVHLVVPFGVGKRQCPGRRFVEMELMLILAKVISKFARIHIQFHWFNCFLLFFYLLLQRCCDFLQLVRTFDISFCDKLEMEFEFLLAPKTPVNLILKERLF